MPALRLPLNALPAPLPCPECGTPRGIYLPSPTLQAVCGTAAALCLPPLAFAPCMLWWWLSGDLARPITGLNFILPLFAGAGWSLLTWYLQRELAPKAASRLPLLTLLSLCAGYLPALLALPFDEDGWAQRARAPLFVIGWGGLCWSIAALFLLSPGTAPRR